MGGDSAASNLFNMHWNVTQMAIQIKEVEIKLVPQEFIIICPYVGTSSSNCSTLYTNASFLRGVTPILMAFINVIYDFKCKVTQHFD